MRATKALANWVFFFLNYRLFIRRQGSLVTFAAAAKLAAGRSQKVEVNVRNEGRLAGDEVVELYLSTPGRADAPRRSLKGFARIHLNAGEERRMSFTLDPRDLAFADHGGVMRIAPGSYSLWIGGGQPGSGAPGLAATFRMTGELALQP